jgi:hypothetical protein
MRRQLLLPVGTESVAGVVRRLGAVAAGFDAPAELAVRVRRQRSQPGEVAAAIASGELIKTFVFRGASHLLTPEDGGVYLALRASGRMWERSSWQTFYGLAPGDWPGLLDVVRAALADESLTVAELGRKITAVPKFAHLDFVFAGDPRTLLKAMAWQGELSLGPARDGHPTLQNLTTNPRWAGIPDLEEAGNRAVEAYFRTYGPATRANLDYWLGNGLGAGRHLTKWIDSLGDRLVTIDVEGTPAQVLADDVEELLSTSETPSVRFLPAFDQWVLGPGTADTGIVPPAHRETVSRGANLAILDGVVSGTWSTDDDRLAVDWFPDARTPPGDLLAAEITRFEAILG